MTAGAGDTCGELLQKCMPETYCRALSRRRGDVGGAVTLQAADGVDSGDAFAVVVSEKQ